jgi:hypothetical protein
LEESILNTSENTFQKFRSLWVWIKQTRCLNIVCYAKTQNDKNNTTISNNKNNYNNYNNNGTVKNRGKGEYEVLVEKFRGLWG